MREELNGILGSAGHFRRERKKHMTGEWEPLGLPRVHPPVALRLTGHKKPAQCLHNFPGCRTIFRDENANVTDAHTILGPESQLDVCTRAPLCFPMFTAMFETNTGFEQVLSLIFFFFATNTLHNYFRSQRSPFFSRSGTSFKSSAQYAASRDFRHMWRIDTSGPHLIGSVSAL